MKKKLIITAALLMSLASCTYNTNSGNYSSKGAYTPVVQPVSVAVQPVYRTVYRPVYVEPVVEVRPVVYSGCYARTILPYGVYCH